MKNKELVIANQESVSNLIDYYMKALNSKQISAEDLVKGLESLKKKVDYILELIEIA